MVMRYHWGHAVGHTYAHSALKQRVQSTQFCNFTPDVTASTQHDVNTPIGNEQLAQPASDSITVTATHDANVADSGSGSDSEYEVSEPESEDFDEQDLDSGEEDEVYSDEEEAIAMYEIRDMY
jgi:hypothetical protein